MRLGACLSVLACALLAGCEQGTVLDVEAKSMPEGQVVYADRQMTLDGSGAGDFSVPTLYSDYIEVTFYHGGSVITLNAECVPPITTPDPIDRLHLLLRRRIADGTCALIADEIEQGGATKTGQYTPELFDDQPCGPFASAP
jgi:hypothetical protein